MGSRSLAALMVSQSFVEMRLGADLGLEPLALTALEEPEAHLHPQAQTAARDLDHKKAHKLRRLVLRPLGDVLFARLVVLGDGATESDALRVFTSAWWGGRDPDGMGVAIPELQQIAAGIRTYDPETLEALATPRGADETDDGVLLEALRKSKGTYGTPVATAIVDHTDDDGRLLPPPAIRELLERADTILGTT